MGIGESAPAPPAQTNEEKARAAKAQADKAQLELAGGLEKYGKAIDKSIAAYLPVPAAGPAIPPAAKLPEFSYIPHPLACCCGGIVASRIAEKAGTAQCGGRYLSMWIWSYASCARATRATCARTSAHPLASRSTRRTPAVPVRNHLLLPPARPQGAHREARLRTRRA